MPSISIFIKMLITLRVESLKFVGIFIKNKSLYKGVSTDTETKFLNPRVLVLIRLLYGTWIGERARHTPSLSLITLLHFPTLVAKTVSVWREISVKCLYPGDDSLFHVGVCRK